MARAQQGASSQSWHCLYTVTGSGRPETWIVPSRDESVDFSNPPDVIAQTLKWVNQTPPGQGGPSHAVALEQVTGLVAVSAASSAERKGSVVDLRVGHLASFVIGLHGADIELSGAELESIGSPGLHGVGAIVLGSDRGERRGAWALLHPPVTYGENGVPIKAVIPTTPLWPGGRSRTPLFALRPGDMPGGYREWIVSPDKLV